MIGKQMACALENLQPPVRLVNLRFPRKGIQGQSPLKYDNLKQKVFGIRLKNYDKGKLISACSFDFYPTHKLQYVRFK